MKVLVATTCFVLYLVMVLAYARQAPALLVFAAGLPSVVWLVVEVRQTGWYARLYYRTRGR